MDANDQDDNVSESPKRISQKPSAEFFKETSEGFFLMPIFFFFF